jgi:FKBP12-rapamycin complex-associated protein
MKLHFLTERSQCLMRGKIPHPKYENLISKLLNGERLPQDAGVLELL